MAKDYKPKDIEQKWQNHWRESGLYEVDTKNAKDPYYALVEFPYPSGNLHAGHWYAFSVPDMRARYMRMKGKDVLFPVGFDSFGLPAENAAIKHGKDPKVWTDSNIEYMTGQLARMGGMFDERRMIRTSDPSYYRWTQWMFARFYEKGLVYRAGTLVNWCPGCKTVLANEQVVDGRCERSDDIVEKREMKQWMLRITQYADELIDDLDTLDWPREIKESQKNWIGRSQGAELFFEIDTDIKRHYVLVHGYAASPDINYHRWLAHELEKRGHTVEIPELPNPKSPNIREQVSYIREHCDIGPDTVLVGHSLGSNVVLRVVEELESSVAGVVLIGGFVSGEFVEQKKREVEFDFDFDAEKIIEKAGIMTLLHDQGEETISDVQWKKLQEVFPDACTSVLPARQEHFRSKEEPAVLRAVLPHVSVFTTRPDTLYGVTYLVIAPEHALLANWKSQAKNWDEVEAYQTKTAAKTDLDRQQSKDKGGVCLEGVSAIHPATGEKVSVWIAEYVLAGYGTGAIMAVPAHDDRDREFAKQHDLPVVGVINSEGLLENSGEFDGTPFEKAKQNITDKVGGKMVTTYKQRDWGISRQRYWGTPIPVVYDPEGLPHLVPDEYLPWKLPTDVDFTPDGTAPLARSKELLARTEKIFGVGWTPEVDTMDAFVDSTWYFLRYLDSANTDAFADREVLDAWMPVDVYSGGAEHTTMHVLYSRFWYKALSDLGYVSGKEPYKIRMNRGLIMGPDGKKMSKSKGNVIDPDREVERFGADSLRTYLAFIGPYNETGHYPWNTDGLAGARRFIEKVWRIADLVQEGDVDSLQYVLHTAITKVEKSFEDFKMNTAVAQLMGLAGDIEKAGLIGREQYEIFLRLLAPIAPHVSEELWRNLGNETSVHLTNWPEANPTHLALSEVTLAVQINGKVRGEITVSTEADEETIKSAALSCDAAGSYLEGKQVKKIIIVPGRLVSIVL